MNLQQRQVLVQQHLVADFATLQLEKARCLSDTAKDIALMLLDEHPDFPRKSGDYRLFLYPQGAGHEPILAWIADLPALKQVVDAFLHPDLKQRVWNWLAGLSDKKQQLNGLSQAILFLTRYDFDFYEYLEYAEILQYYEIRTVLQTLAIEAIHKGDEKCYNQIVETLQANAEIGSVSQFNLFILLRLKRQAAWEFAEKLLLAAQRQENIREVVLYALVGAEWGAYKLLLRTLLNHQLLRFASVTRQLGNLFDLKTYWTTEAAFVQPLLETAVQCLEQPETIDSVLQSKDVGICYIALWAQLKINPAVIADQLKMVLASEHPPKQAMALAFLQQTPMARSEQQTIAIEYLETDDYTVLNQVLGTFYVNTMTFTNRIFEQLQKTLLKMPSKPISIKNQPFWWQNIHQLSKDNILAVMMNCCLALDKNYKRLKPYYAEMSAWMRNSFLQDWFKPIFAYLAYERNPHLPPVSKPEPWNLTPEESLFVYAALSEREAQHIKTGLDILKFVPCTNPTIAPVTKLLTRKTGEVRQIVISFLLELPDKFLQSAVESLLSASNEEQRIGGLDMLQQLKKQMRLMSFVQTAIETFALRKNILHKEELLLRDLQKKEKVHYDKSNGFGLYQPNTIAEPILIAPTTGFFIEKVYQKPDFGFSMPIKAVQAKLKALDQLIADNAQYEYTLQIYDDSIQTYLLGANGFNGFHCRKPDSEETLTQKFQKVPLSEVWAAWYEGSGLTSMDLFLLSLPIHQTSYLIQDVSVPEWLKNLISLYFNPNGAILPSNLNYERLVSEILRELHELHALPPVQRFSFILDYTEHYFANIPAEYRFKTFQQDAHWEKTWKNVFNGLLQFFPSEVTKENEIFFNRVWRILLWWNWEMLEKPLFYHHYPIHHSSILSYVHYTQAFQYNLISIDAIYEWVMNNRMNQIKTLTHPTHLTISKFFESYPIFKEVIERSCERILEIELVRGDTPTPVSELAANIQRIHGIDYFVKILKGLGKDIFQRGYSYHGLEKKVIFSKLLKNTFALETETFDLFKTKIEVHKISETRLIEGAMYAPQWLGFVGDYLNWNGFESAAWWLHAHSNDHLDAQKETKVAQYTPISTQDFKDGAVDVQWFQEMFRQLGAHRFEPLYDAAKYISDGIGHSRARLYADAILGKLPVEDCRKRVAEKRNKDYVIAYGLIPLNAGAIQTDVLNRYKFLAAFKKESKEFGAQRQSSEQLAVRLSLENLARTAGYADPIRLTWAMETIDSQILMQKIQTLTFNDTTIQLSVNALGKAAIEVVKATKILKEIPVAVKKSPEVQELLGFKHHLNSQLGRIRQGLEDAMLRGDLFHGHEIERFLNHPIIKPLLTNLVLVSSGKLGFYSNGALHAPSGEQTLLNADSQIQIAHCSDLFASGQWGTYQRHAFETKLVQPFKQIFRELYLPSGDELENGKVSNRYSGYQVQKAQAAALLKTRGWTVNYYDGMQKVYYASNLVVRLNAYADWFNSGVSETPILESITFHHRKTGEKHFLKDIESRIFSEVMRDIDLIISVANVGGVEIETSLSTLELRRVLVEETLRLFKITNVELKEKHAIIQGVHETYSLHLGSGMIHRMPGAALYMVSVSTQQRGRLFLPFVDEDPRTAEIISKILLLSKGQQKV